MNENFRDSIQFSSEAGHLNVAFECYRGAAGKLSFQTESLPSKVLSSNIAEDLLGYNKERASFSDQSSFVFASADYNDYGVVFTVLSSTWC